MYPVNGWLVSLMARHNHMRICLKCAEQFDHVLEAITCLRQIRTEYGLKGRFDAHIRFFPSAETTFIECFDIIEHMANVNLTLSCK